ncbi:MAG: hypothetical protein B6D45_11055 [Ignavibacteriales bacterium UTCHB3]|nr:MAG: hypothetical protein B6D45_11055 [Ignavibacteriales bacterium UTCHB3]
MLFRFTSNYCILVVNFRSILELKRSVEFEYGQLEKKKLYKIINITIQFIFSQFIICSVGNLQQYRESKLLLNLKSIKISEY